MIHCPSCAGPLRFDIESQSMACDYCHGRFDPQAIRDNTRDDAKGEQVFDTYVYICPSCGAEIATTDQNDAVGFCPYCGGASMIFDKLRRDWCPDVVIPFRVTKEQCKQAYVKEVRRHLFVSRKYRDPKLIESFRGIYMPYWNYQAQIKGGISIKADSPEISVGNNNYTTDHYKIEGQSDTTLTGFSHDASISFDDHLSEKLAPYELSGKVAFTPAYLCGFYAEVGDADARHYTQYAQDTFKAFFEDKLEESPQLEAALKPKKLKVTSYGKVPYKVNISERGLYPVWFMSYRRGNKITYATVNGQTGKVGADLPLSPLRIIIAVLALGAALFGLTALLMNVLPSIKPTTMLGLSVVFTLSGIHMMQHSLLKIVDNAVRNSEYTIKNNRSKFSERFDLSDSPVLTFLVTLGTSLSIVMYTSDGSYDHFFGTIGKFGALAGIVFIVFQHIRQSISLQQLKRMQFQGDSLLRNGIISASQSFVKVNLIAKIVLYITTAFHLIIVIKDPASFSMIYTLSIFAVAELFIYAVLHLRFQAAFAKRALPQFKKKGALYDEN